RRLRTPRRRQRGPADDDVAADRLDPRRAALEPVHAARARPRPAARARLGADAERDQADRLLGRRLRDRRRGARRGAGVRGLGPRGTLRAAPPKRRDTCLVPTRLASPVARILPTVVVLALLGCTAAAFAVTEGLKLEHSPISRTAVDKVVAPDSASHATASIQFVLRKRDRVTVELVNGSGQVVRTLVRSRRLPAGLEQFSWNGRND